MGDSPPARRDNQSQPDPTMADLMRVIQQMQTQMQTERTEHTEKIDKMQAQTNQLIATVNALTESKASSGTSLPNVTALPGAQFGATDIRQKQDNPNDTNKVGATKSKPPKGPGLPPTEVVVSEDEETGLYTKRTQSLPNIKPFKFGDKDADWTTWVKQFVRTIKGYLHPKTQNDLFRICLEMLPAYLNPAAHNALENCQHQDDWPKLILELEECFDDPRIKQNWQTDFKAYKWDGIEPLHVYKGNVMRYVDKYDEDLRGLTKPLRKAYFNRFLAGLPTDYHDFVDQQLYDENRIVENALKSAQKFQGMKERRSKEEQANKYAKEVGASANFNDADKKTNVTFESSNTHERLRAIERNIEQLNTERNKQNRASSDDRFPNSPYPRGSRDFNKRSQSYQSSGNTRSYGGSRNRYDGMSFRDRANRFKNRDSNSSSSRFSSRQESKSPARNYRNSQFRQGNPKNQQHRSRQEDEDNDVGGLIETDGEDEADGDETLAAFYEDRDRNEEADFYRFREEYHAAQENC